MRNWLTIAITAIALSACASDRARTQQFERYEVLAAEPTPSDWEVGAVWTFVTTRREGKEVELTFRISDAAADTCIYGDWRSLDLLDGDLGSLAGTPFKAAAQIEGRNLWISLRSNCCDLNDDVKGELLGSVFTGQRTSGGMHGSVLVGQVRGWRVR